MLNRKIWISVISLGFIVLSCQKEPDFNDLENNGCRLTKIIQGDENGGGDDTTLLFYYDNAGRINRIDDIQWGDTSNYTLEYDNQGRLIKITDTTAWSYESIYDYNPDGKLGAITYAWPDTQKVVFEYNGQESPTKLTFYDKNAGAWDYDYEQRYTYTNGNVTTVETIFNGLSTKDFFEYDNTIGNNELSRFLALIAFRTVRLDFYDAHFYFNKNMPKKSIYAPFNTECNFTYLLDQGRIANMKVIPANNAWIDNNFYYFDCK